MLNIILSFSFVISIHFSVCLLPKYELFLTTEHHSCIDLMSISLAIFSGCYAIVLNVFYTRSFTNHCLSVYRCVCTCIHCIDVCLSRCMSALLSVRIAFFLAALLSANLVLCLRLCMHVLLYYI